jgi:hypothetical protein
MAAACGSARPLLFPLPPSTKPAASCASSARATRNGSCPCPRGCTKACGGCGRPRTAEIHAGPCPVRPSRPPTSPAVAARRSAYQKQSLTMSRPRRASFERCRRFGFGGEISKQHAHPHRPFRFVNHAFPRKFDGVLRGFAILCSRKASGEASMATPQVKTVRKTAPAARRTPAEKTAGTPKATPVLRKLAATKAANRERTATSLLTSPPR